MQQTFRATAAHGGQRGVWAKAEGAVLVSLGPQLAVQSIWSTADEASTRNVFLSATSHQDRSEGVRVKQGSRQEDNQGSCRLVRVSWVKPDPRESSHAHSRARRALPHSLLQEISTSSSLQLEAAPLMN